jgi:hypothetical protein
VDVPFVTPPKIEQNPSSYNVLMLAVLSIVGSLLLPIITPIVFLVIAIRKRRFSLMALLIFTTCVAVAVWQATWLPSWIFWDFVFLGGPVSAPRGMD